MRRTRKRLWTGILISVSTLVILLAIVVGAVRIFDMLSPRLRNDIATELSAQIERPVSIGQLDLGWRHWRPTLILRDCSILTHDRKGSILTAQELAIAVSWKALLQAQLRPAAFDLRGFTLGLEWQPDGSLSIRDINGGPLVIDYALLSKWAGRIDAVRIENSTLEWYTPGIALPLRMTGVQLRMDRHHDGYSLHAATRLPAQWGSSAEFNAEAEGDLADMAKLNVSVHGQLTGLRPQPWLQPYLRPELRLTGATVDAQVSLRLADLAPTAASLKLQATPGQLYHQGSDKLLATLPGPGADLQLHSNSSGGWLLDIKSLRYGDDQPASGTLQFKTTADGLGGDLHAQLDRLDLKAVVAWLAILKQGGAMQLPFSGAQGELRNISFDWHSQSQQPRHYQFSAELHDAGLPATGTRPGFKGLSGNLQADSNGGQLQLNVPDGLAEIPTVFDQPLPLKPLTGTLLWKQQDQGWEVQGKELHLQLPGLQASTDFTLQLPPAGSPVLHLKGSFNGEVWAARPFVPHPPVLDQEVKDWLQSALVKGHASNGIVEIDGALADFPYTEPGQTGHFLVTLDASNGELVYAPGWPGIQDISGTLRIAGMSMQINARTARMLDSDIGPASVRIDDFSDPHLIVDGVADNGAAKQFSFLAASPLRSDYQKLTESLQLQGPSTLYLHLNLPLADMDKFQVDGRVALKGISLRYDSLTTPVTGITGELAFNQNGLHADHLSGKVLGLPVSARLTPATIEGRQGVRLEAELQVQLPQDAKALSSVLDPTWLSPFSGTSHWRLSSVLFTDAKPSDFQLLSDLVGMRIDLGAPFAKPADTAMPAEIIYRPGAQGFDLFTRLGSELKTRMAFRSNAQGNAELERGIIQLGGRGKPELPKAPGIWLTGSLPELDVDASSHFLAAISNGKRGTTADTGDDSGAADLLRGGNVQFGVLRLASQNFQKVDMQLTPTTDGWHMVVSGPDATGDMQWHSAGRGELVGNFKTLRLRPPPDTKNQPAGAGNKQAPPPAHTDAAPVPAAAFDPSALPSVKLQTQQMFLGDYALGAGRFDLAAIDAGVALQDAALTGGSLTINASGEWTRKNGLSSAKLSGAVSSSDVKGLLAAAGFAPSITADKANIKLDANWTPDAAGLTYNALNGKINVSLKDGAFLEVEPGAGRVLALLNFYALPKRLRLNFKDVVGKGTQFDELHGQFDISKGIATTQDMQVRSTAAEIKVRGSVDLGRQLYDQTVTVTPKLDKVGNSVALAGAALGGPVVGLAIYLVKEILDKPVDNLARITYHLGGSFSDPEISKVSAEQARKEEKVSTPAAPPATTQPETGAPAKQVPTRP